MQIENLEQFVKKVSDIDPPVSKKNKRKAVRKKTFIK